MKRVSSSGRRKPKGKLESSKPHTASVRGLQRSCPRHATHTRFSFNVPRRKIKESKMGLFVNNLPMHPFTSIHLCFYSNILLSNVSYISRNVGKSREELIEQDIIKSYL